MRRSRWDGVATQHPTIAQQEKTPMSAYTITISPQGNSGGPQTTIQVDIATGAARVVELSVRAPDGAGLSAHELPVIDVAALVAALAPPATQAAAALPAPARGQGRAPARSQRRAPEAEPAQPAATTARSRRSSKREPTAATTTGRTRATANGRTASRPGARAGSKAGTTRTRKPAATKTVATGTRRGAAAGDAAATKASRAYRRMPDQRELVAVVRKASSVNAIAEHFEVPRHTVNGWLRRLRALGLLAPAR